MIRKITTEYSFTIADPVEALDAKNLLQQIVSSGQSSFHIEFETFDRKGATAFDISVYEVHCP